MPQRTSIGVDIGSSAVRAAEITSDGKTSRLRRFAQVGLPAGAVVEGEVRDKAVVAVALKKLWSEGGFSSRKVVLGVSSQRAMVRVINRPAVADKELRSALRYEVAELLPIPLEQAVLDFCLLDGSAPPSDDAGPGRALVAVAQKDIVWDEVEVARKAGLVVTAVDASPLALLRAMPPSGVGAAMDAIVSVGAQLVVVVIRQAGTPVFMRTAVVATDVEAHSMVGANARLTPAPGRDKPEPQFVTGRNDPIVEEVRSSIEFFSSHAHGAHLEHLYLTGGGALAPGLANRLSVGLALPVLPAVIEPDYNASTLGLEQEKLKDASARWVTAVGLALWGTRGSLAPNLLPPEIVDRARQRVTVELAGAGLLAIIVGLGALSVSRAHETSSVNAKTAVDLGQTATLQAEIARLGSYTKVAARVQSRRALAAAALSSDVDWVALRARIEKALPAGDRVANISFTASPSSSAPSSGPATTGTPTFVGQVSIGAETTGGLPSVAALIKRMTTVKGLAATWVASTTAASGAPTGANQELSFTVTAEVTNAALSNRGDALPGGTK